MDVGIDDIFLWDLGLTILLFCFLASRTIFIFASGCLEIDIITSCYIQNQGMCDAQKSSEKVLYPNIIIDTPTWQENLLLFIFLSPEPEMLPCVTFSNNTGQLNKVGHNR